MGAGLNDSCRSWGNWYLTVDAVLLAVTEQEQGLIKDDPVA
jgi:hypothetical protein